MNVAQTISAKIMYHWFWLTWKSTWMTFSYKVSKINWTKWISTVLIKARLMACSSKDVIIHKLVSNLKVWFKMDF